MATLIYPIICFVSKTQNEYVFLVRASHCHIGCHFNNLFLLPQVSAELHSRPQFDSVLPRVPSDLHSAGEGCGGTSE